MKLLPCCISSLAAGAIALASAGISVADDGPMFRKNVSNTSDLETEHATIRMLPLYVPAQASNGELVDAIEYLNDNETVVETRTEARPLITLYNDGHVEFIEEEGYGGFPGHGERDAFAAVSLDDGATWKNTNLSRSADRSSIRIKVNKKWVAYPGDVLRTFAASDGNKVLFTWVSKYCGSGSPAYAMTVDDGGEQDLLAAYLEGTGTIESAADCTDDDPQTPCTYLEDTFGVAGSQGVQSGDELAEDGYGLVGDYPFSCAWAARGVLLPPEATGSETSTFVWFKAERLSSGVRSANRPEAVCVKGAGCVVTWQEDPEGIRPGHGDGPGEGWSGAIAHHQTDTWYTYIDWSDFDLVSEDGTYGTFYGGESADLTTSGANLAAWVADNPTGSPKAAIPMSIPVRLTDNAMCTSDDLEAEDFTSKAYCGIDFDGSGTPDFCASTVIVNIEVPDEDGLAEDHEVSMCVTEDGRLMRGNTASTRARLGLHGYSSDPGCVYDPADPASCPIDSAWFYMAYEENKGLGDICDDGDCPDEEMTDADKRDMGKNVWYHTFDMFKPELVSQGLMLNQPAVYPDDWTDPTPLLVAAPLFEQNFYAFDIDPIYETQAGITSTTLYQTEISRRPSKLSQDWYDKGPSGTVGFQLWKQGIIRRGGPADIMARRFVMEDVCTTRSEWCPGEYLACTSEYQTCSTTYTYYRTDYQELQFVEECHTEKVLNRDNPKYNPTPSCNSKPDQLKCFPYLDPDDNPTHEQESEIEICETGETWVNVDFCDVGDPDTCRTVTTPEIVDSCDGLQNCDEELVCSECNAGEDNCELVEVCITCEEGDDNCSLVENCQPVDSCDGLTDCQEQTSCETDDNVNPYGYGNMVCENADGSSAWVYVDDTNNDSLPDNPRYVKGFCAAPAINLSGNTIIEGTCGDAAACLLAFPFNDYFDDLLGGSTTEDTSSEEDLGIDKVYVWQQFGQGYIDETVPDDNNLDDQSWENPYDMAKGHRGFMAGDMIMAMYAWTPNWNDLTNAHSIVNLYVRRSFDGGMTWSTLPASFEHTNGETYTGTGTTTCEWIGPISEQLPECTTYAAGAFEQARNVSQLTGSKVTVLDPRFSPTTRSITEASVTSASLPAGFSPGECTGEEGEICDNLRDPSRFFMVYETGIPSAYDAGEATPLDLFYSRGVEWGDHYLVWQDTAESSTCIPSVENTELAGFCNEFDAIEGSKFSESGEAAVTASPGGQFFYSAWNQWDFEDEIYLVGTDAWFRRVLFLDDYVPTID